MNYTISIAISRGNLGAASSADADRFVAAVKREISRLYSEASVEVSLTRGEQRATVFGPDEPDETERAMRATIEAIWNDAARYGWADPLEVAREELRRVDRMVKADPKYEPQVEGSYRRTALALVGHDTAELVDATQGTVWVRDGRPGVLHAYQPEQVQATVERLRALASGCVGNPGAREASLATPPLDDATYDEAARLDREKYTREDRGDFAPPRK